MSQEVKNQLTEVTQDEPEQETNELDGLENHYIFSPSITRRKTVCGKTYTVRSYYAGGKDFRKAITWLAKQQAYKAR